MKYLPFSYSFDNSISAYRQTIEFLEDNEQMTSQLLELSWAFHSITNVVPHSYENWWSGHYFPITESIEEFEVSYLLCCQGFYKQSMVSLRAVLETGLLSVYYNLNDKGHETVQGWFQSEEGKKNDTPYSKKVWKKLETYPNIDKFQKTYDLKADIDNLNSLHNYVHSKGVKYSNGIGIVKSNTQIFEKKAFVCWFEKAKEVVRVILILHLLKFPLGIIDYDFTRKFGIDIPTFGALNSFHIGRIKTVLGKEVYDKLLVIALEDQAVIKFINEIESMPDITQEEINEQIKYIYRMIGRD